MTLYDLKRPHGSLMARVAEEARRRAHSYLGTGVAVISADLWVPSPRFPRPFPHFITARGAMPARPVHGPIRSFQVCSASSLLTPGPRRDDLSPRRNDVIGV